MEPTTTDTTAPGTTDDTQPAVTETFVAFPRIGRLCHLADNLPYFSQAPDVLNFDGTVKLHGTNLGIRQASAGALLTCQSRNRELTVGQDNCGSAVFVSERAETFSNLFQTVRDRCEVDSEAPVMMYGELAGQRIQSGVGISKAPKFFAIFCVTAGGRRIDMKRLADVHDNDSRIFNVMQYGQYQLQMQKHNPLAVEEEVKQLTEAVGSDCPAARVLGFPGSGEGIVWKCREVDNSKLWFKSKCEAHMVGYAVEKPPRNLSEAQAYAETFAEATVPEARLQQGLDYLREFNLPAHVQSTGTFVKWIIADVLKEEGQELRGEQKLLCQKAVSRKAAEWYKKHCF